jgi:hypothetical protein
MQTSRKKPWKPNHKSWEAFGLVGADECPFLDLHYRGLLAFGLLAKSQLNKIVRFC